MNRIQRLLRLRKQDDCIKLALLLLLAAGWLAFTACIQGAAYARLLARPAEYVLESSFSGAVLDSNLKRIQELEAVVGISRQREFTLTRGEKVLKVTELERQYLTDCYGIELSAMGRSYWLNQAAFGSFLGSEAVSPARVTYKTEEKTESGDFFLLADFGGEDACGVTPGSTMTLGSAATFRVMLKHADPSGADVRRLGELGFTLLDQQAAERRNGEARLILTKLSYASIAAFFALAAALTLLKYSRMLRSCASLKGRPE